MGPTTTASIGVDGGFVLSLLRGPRPKVVRWSRSIVPLSRRKRRKDPLFILQQQQKLHGLCGIYRAAAKRGKAVAGAAAFSSSLWQAREGLHLDSCCERTNLRPMGRPGLATARPRRPRGCSLLLLLPSVHSVGARECFHRSSSSSSLVAVAVSPSSSSALWQRRRRRRL